MDNADVPDDERVFITREGLADGSLLRLLRALAIPGLVIRSDEAIAESLDQTLAGHDPASDVWVFGYGSLMWNPAFAFAGRQVGLVRGWHRRFCLRVEVGRGSPENPGLALALDRGGSCQGVAFRIAAVEARAELLLIWRREMIGSAYIPRWVQVRTLSGTVSAITFVIDRASAHYAGKLADATAAAYIARATGPLGSCMAYLQNTLDHLGALGIRDAGLRRIADAIIRNATELQAAG